MRLIPWMLLWLAVVPLAVGAPETITRYVDTDTGDNGNDGTSWEDAWATMAYAEDQYSTYGENADGVFYTTGVTYPEGIIGRLYLRGSAADTTTVDWSGPRTSATNYMECIGDGTYTLSVSNTYQCMRLAFLDHSIFSDITFQVTSVNADNRHIIAIPSAAASSNIRFIACRFVGADNDSYASSAFRLSDAQAYVKLNNCLITGMGQNAGSAGVGVAAGIAYVYNTTIDGCYNGVSIEADSTDLAYVKNTCVSDSDGDAYVLAEGDGTLEATYCTGDDASVLTHDTGSTCTGSVSPTFTGDYQLAETDTTWIDGGMDLSEDPYWFDDWVDAWDTVRPQGEAPDIGWFESNYGGDTGPPSPGPLKMFFPPFVFGA